MSRAWFVTGTDTGVGKTTVSCALLHAAARTGLTTAAVKPVAAGCDEQGHNEDALQLMSAMTASMEYAQVNPVALELPVAPHIAAARAGRHLQASRIVGLCRGVMLGAADFVLIEGAGGWLVPINARETMADIAKALQCGVILVVGLRLGCINHALLTAQAIRRDGLELAGWVANQPGARMASQEENLAMLRHALPAPCLGEVPYLPSWSAAAASEHLDIRLLGAN